MKIIVNKFFIAIILIPICFLGISCSITDGRKDDVSEHETKNIKFDQKKWKTKQGKDYPFRDYMLTDLMNSNEFRALKTDQLLSTLGKPDYYRDDSSYLYYRIDESRLGFWTLHTKTLVIKMAEDSTITWMKIHE